MAQRRMISKKVTDTDLFLDMPPTTQNLYFHLNINADDDGFVGNPNVIRRNVSASPDDFRILEAKQFILKFETGIIVIKHWKVHNYIRTDRYTETEYKLEKSMLTEVDNKYEIENVIPHVIPMVDTGKVRLGKDREEKIIVEKEKDKKHCYGKYNRVKLTDKEYDKLKLDYPDIDDYINLFDEYVEINNNKNKYTNM